MLLTRRAALVGTLAVPFAAHAEDAIGTAARPLRVGVTSGVHAQVLERVNAVVAAKGLLRFPELQAARKEPTIAAVTEYFLVGSFVSWLVALTTLVVLAR